MIHLSHLVSSYLVSSYLVSSYLILSYLVLYYSRNRELMFEKIMRADLSFPTFMTQVRTHTHIHIIHTYTYTHTHYTHTHMLLTLSIPSHFLISFLFYLPNLSHYFSTAYFHLLYFIVSCPVLTLSFLT